MKLKLFYYLHKLFSFFFYLDFYIVTSDGLYADFIICRFLLYSNTYFNVEKLFPCTKKKRNFETTNNLTFQEKPKLNCPLRICQRKKKII